MIEPLLKLVWQIKSEKLQMIFSLICKLFNSSEIEKDICQQFHKNRGLQLIKRFKLLEERSNVNLVDILSIICQFCRISKTYYKNIDELNIYDDIKRCFSSPIAGESYFQKISPIDLKLSLINLL